MTKPTRLIIAGLGPGNPTLVTLSALLHAQESDMRLVPRSRKNEKGLAEKILIHHMPNAKLIPVLFPMTHDTHERDNLIRSQLEALRPEIERARNIFFPVIGDSMLYSTGAYLLEAMRGIIPDVDAEFVPGISAHSLAAACAKRFLAMSDEILTIIPGTASHAKILNALKHSDAVAIYKPSALKDLRKIVNEAGSFSTIYRVDHAGDPLNERISWGDEALNDSGEYMSVVILRR
ncbi:MAG: precorrin-2 C(20)-methyltransferase [Synergistaceae bacterium]|nr:precorrin-2 C(20)-methyltransferase [Synergistaceae bacterium]